MTHLVLSSMQPGGAFSAQMSAVEVAVSAGTQRTRQRGAEAAAHTARRPHGLLTLRGERSWLLDTARVYEVVTADTEVDASRHCARRTVYNRRPTQLKTSPTDTRPRLRSLLRHSPA